MFQQGSIEGGSVGVNIGGGKGTKKPFVPDDSCGDDIFDGAMEDQRSPQLPYLTQDLWTCERKTENISAWVMEDENLKVTITPQYSGKVWAIYDKKKGSDVLFNNRAHQPANIGALKSWAAGGAEWNWSPGIIGHSAFAETQVYLAKVPSSRGDVLRVYEFDRYNGTVWQVDMIILNGSFVAHPRVTNPTENDLRGYWWTCVAVDAKPSTRIFAPATHVAETSRDPMRNAPWPYFAEAIENASFAGYENAWMTDNSYLGNHQIGDMFLRIPDTVYTPYIAHNQANDDGYVLVHGHPLNGTKFYTWGQSGPGRFMQDFLAGGGKRQGDYAELQVGPAPTQMQNFFVAKKSVIEWTEWFKGFYGDDSILRGNDYSAALSEIDNWIKSDSGMKKEVVDDIDSFFESIATVEPTEILVTGQSWGALEELLLKKQLAPGLKFTLSTDVTTVEYQEAQPWIELIQSGTFSETTLSRLPISYQTTDRWLAVLEQSVEKFGMTWLHALFIGICYAERGDIEQPKELFKLSLKLKPNPIAARCLAVLSSTQEDAWPFYELAWSILQKGDNFALDKEKASNAEYSTYERVTFNLITEISFFLQQALWYPEMESFVKIVLDGNYLEKYSVDAFITMHVKVLMNQNQYNEAIAILKSNCFPTYAKARDDLMNMWNTAVVGLAQLKSEKKLTNVQQHQIRMSYPIPDNIGCQYASKYCINYW